MVPFRSLGAIAWAECAAIFVKKGRYLTIEPNLAAAIYITHLHHKQKSLSSPEVQRRLAYYEDVLAAPGNDLDGDPLDIIRAVRSRTADLKTATRRAYAALGQMGVEVRILRMAPLLDRARRRLEIVIGGNDMPLLADTDRRPRWIRENHHSQHLGRPAWIWRVEIQECLPGSLYCIGVFFHIKERYAHTSHKAKNLVDENMLPAILAIAVFRWWPLIITSSIGRFLREPGRRR